MHSGGWNWEMKEGIHIESKDFYRLFVAVICIVPVRMYLHNLILNHGSELTIPLNVSPVLWLHILDKLLLIGGILLIFGWQTRAIGLTISAAALAHLLFVELIQSEVVTSTHMGFNVVFLSTMILLVILGSGKFSIDYYIHKHIH